MTKILTLALVFFGLFVCSAPVLRAQTTEFTYQGSLKDNAAPANANYDFEFALFDALADSLHGDPCQAGQPAGHHDTWPAATSKQRAVFCQKPERR
jgi:hypothetical protein